mgnify:CR=1 FL=1
MKQFLTLIFFAATFFLHAAAPPRGDERLRELVVFPGLDSSFHWNITCENNEYVITGDRDLPGVIAEQREKLKKQPDDVKQLMHLAYLLDTHDETNEAQLFYQKAEQLCRDKAAANPRDGLSLVELGKALAAADKNAEAESTFRRATLVASNEWKYWVNLGVFSGERRIARHVLQKCVQCIRPIFCVGTNAVGGGSGSIPAHAGIAQEIRIAMSGGLPMFQSRLGDRAQGAGNISSTCGIPDGVQFAKLLPSLLSRRGKIQHG